jgi:murein L,D-transpeptidase YcbB/YkuD
MKFMFPNDHAVYIHDTPSRSLFRAERRALSSGCVRVDQPFRLAQAVLEDEAAETRLKRLIGEKGERTIMLRRPLPVHLAYFTLVVDDAGRLQSRADIYGVDEKVKAALGLRG